MKYYETDIQSIPEVSIEKQTGNNITLRCLDLEYNNVFWKVKNIFVQKADLIKLSGMNSSHLLSNELTIRKLKISDSGKYKCFKNKKDNELIISIDLKVIPNIKKAFTIVDDYEMVLPVLKKTFMFIAFVALLSVINRAVNDYSHNKELDVIVDKKKKDCYDIQKFLRINLEEFDKVTLKTKQLSMTN